jgi:hypothetical protein
LETLKFYLFEAIFPFFQIGVVHPVDSVVFPWTATDILGNLATLSLIAFILYLSWQKGRWVWIFWAGLACLMPALGFVRLSLAGDSLAADRLLTAPLAFWCLIPAVLPWRESKSLPWVQCVIRHLPHFPLPWMVRGAILGWLGLAVLTTNSIVPLWRNETLLWQYAASLYPENYYVRHNYLIQLFAAGTAEQLDRELKDAQRVFAADPQISTQLLLRRGIFEIAQRNPQGMVDLQKVIELFPLARLHERFPEAKSIQGMTLSGMLDVVNLYALLSEGAFVLDKHPNQALAWLEIADWYAQRSGEQVQNLLPLYRRTAYLYALGRVAEADALRAQAPGDPRLSGLLSEYCVDAKQPHCAELAARGLVNQEPAHVPTHP